MREELRRCQRKAVNDHNNKRRKKALDGLIPIQFKSKLERLPNTGYSLKLKPRNPVQPKERTQQEINKSTVQ